MNKHQTDYLRSITCNIIDRYQDLEEELKMHGIPQKHIKKITKALDLIYQVNNACNWTFEPESAA